MSGTISLGSKNAKGQNILIKLSAGRIEVYVSGTESVTGATDDVTAAKCEYTKDENNSDALFYVTN